MEKLIQQKKEFTIFGGCGRNDMAAYFYESAFSKLKKQEVVDYLLHYLIYTSPSSPFKTHKNCVCTQTHTHTWNLILKTIYSQRTLISVISACLYINPIKQIQISLLFSIDR